MPEQEYSINTEQEEDGRWIAEILDLPGVVAYGASREEAIANAEALAFSVIADRIEETKIGTSRVPFASALSHWPSSKARRAFSAIQRLGWVIKTI